MQYLEQSEIDGLKRAEALKAETPAEPVAEADAKVEAEKVEEIEDTEKPKKKK